jgi:hypothetical protein
MNSRLIAKVNSPTLLKVFCHLNAAMDDEIAGVAVCAEWACCAACCFCACIAVFPPKRTEIEKPTDKQSANAHREMLRWTTWPMAIRVSVF